MIEASDKDAVVSGKPGRSTSFEVTVNSKVVFSKLKSGAFPDMSKVVEAIKEYDGKGDIAVVMETEPNSCIIL